MNTKPAAACGFDTPPNLSSGPHPPPPPFRSRRPGLKAFLCEPPASLSPVLTPFAVLRSRTGRRKPFDGSQLQVFPKNHQRRKKSLDFRPHAVLRSGHANAVQKHRCTARQSWRQWSISKTE